jgi:hypothetical protein
VWSDLKKALRFTFAEGGSMRLSYLRISGLLLTVLGCQSRAETAGEPATRDSALAEASVSAQAVRRSDTMHVYVHNVKAGKEAEYERWVREVWMRSLEKAGQKYPEVRQANESQRLFAPTAKREDGTSNYVWLFEPAPPSSPVTDSWTFPDSFLVAGGYSPSDADAQAKTLWALVTTAEGGEVVRKF